MTSSCESRGSTGRLVALPPAVAGGRADRLNLDQLNPANIVRDERMGVARRMTRGDSEGARAVRDAAHRAAAAAVERDWEAGYAAGLTAGQIEGVRSARSDADRAVAALTAAVIELRSGAATDLAEAEDALVAGAFELAAVVLERELEVATNPGADALRRALALVPSGEVEAHLHPDDLAALGPDVPGSESVTLVADAQIERGGCVLVNGATSIDAQLGPALARARALMLGATATCGTVRATP